MSMRKCRVLSKPESLILCICWYHLFLFKLSNILVCCIWFGWCISQGSSETRNQWDIKRKIYFKKCVHTIVGTGNSEIKREGWKESQVRVDVADQSLNLQGMPADRKLRRAFYAAAQRQMASSLKVSVFGLKTLHSWDEDHPHSGG